jgi:simple sugar transport system ATP-binding protein
MSAPPALRLEGISKSFGLVRANRDVSFEVARGAVHALVGENGAGKSTLLAIISGATRPDAGRMWLGGAEVPLASHSPAAAIARGVGLVHQHFMLVGPLTVAENVVLGREPRRRLAVDRARAEAQVAALGKELGLVVDPRRRVEDLTVGEQQRVEILKALWRGADLLLLDEPTAVLTPPEVRTLFAILEQLAQGGKTIVLVTHKLDEVAAIAGATTVLRGGRVAAGFPGRAAAGEIARAIVGGEAPPPPRKRSHELGAPVLTVEGLAAGRLAGVSFQLRAGEILGIAGVQGNGQTELVLALAGLLAARGTVRLGGAPLARGPRARFAAGLGHIAEDRHLRGIILDFTLTENLVLGRQRELPFGRAALAAYARDRLAALDVRPGDPAAPARALSGGNQQKLVVARELGRPGLRLLLAAEPTRGVDIGATAAIHDQLLAAAAGGAAVLLVSSELSELRALADRLLVFFRGQVAAELPPTASDETLGTLMTGAAA